MNDLPSTHEQYMRQAIALAQQALPQDVPVGALVVYHGEIIATGYNRREIDGNPVGHAEILALQATARHLGRWRLSETLLYVTLEPCPMCASAIVQARVGQVIFGAYDPVMGACGSRHALLLDSPEIPLLGGVLETDCSQQLRDFFKQARQK
jgi:tRNA(adenine34) deaminase